MNTCNTGNKKEHFGCKQPPKKEHQLREYFLQNFISSTDGPEKVEQRDMR